MHDGMIRNEPVATHQGAAAAHKPPYAHPVSLTFQLGQKTSCRWNGSVALRGMILIENVLLMENVKT